MHGDKRRPATKISIDRRIAQRAGRQHGNITRKQLLEMGVSGSWIDRRVRAGSLHVEHAGVYSVGRPARTTLERASAAVLACGEEAALGGFSALELWGWRRSDAWIERHEVILPAGVDRRPKNVRVRRSSELIRRDVRRHRGIRLTSPARTLLDCSPQMSQRRLTRVVNDALLTPHLSRDQLAELLTRTRKHPGKKLLLPFVDTDQAPTRSPLEDLFLEFLERYEFPIPRINVKRDGREIDAVFAEANLIVELDGYPFHSDRDTFERDREKDAEALRHGTTTVRITQKRLSEQPDREAERLTEIIDRQSRRDAA